MSILPKVYRFVYIPKSKKQGPGTAFMVARNEANAVKLFMKHGKALKQEARQYTVMKESWLANLLILLLPKYVYKGGKWSEWRESK